MHETTDSLQGTINRFLFQNTETGYMVFVLDLNSTNTVTVKGKLPPLQAGQEVELTGTWIIDPKYGRQFEALTCRGSLPTSIIGLKRFLASGLIKGVGKVYAEKLVNYFGKDTLDIIDKNPQRLAEVPGLAKKRIETISNAWQEHKEIAEIMVFLQDKGISQGVTARIYKKYKHNTIPYVLQNPYRLAEEVWGIGFKTADEVAQKLGFALDCPQRINAGILFALLVGNQQGHLYSQVEDLKKSAFTLLELQEETAHIELFKQQLAALYEQGKVKLVTKDEQCFITTTRCYNAEQGVASKLKELIAKASSLTFDIAVLYEQLSNNQKSSVILNAKQIEGILNCLRHKVTIITGGPGTGKTTLIKQLLGLLEEGKVSYKLAAPTGRAAKRINEGTGRSAATIHRLLEFEPLSMSFKHNEKNALPLDFLIVDEASMIDVFLAHALLKAVPFAAHVLLIGDVDQLPSVGAGNFLNDCIASGVIPCIRLTEVFRQAQNSLIITNAHRVNRGEFPVTFLPDSRQDFAFIKEEDPAQLPHHLKRILFSDLPKRHIKVEDAIVLTPMNRGAAGTQVLNHHLQTLLNGGKQDSFMFNGISFKVGDRVMQIRNNYDKFVFNGDIGVIESIDSEDRLMNVTFGERTFEYDFTDLNELVLAYAVTIHKSQGSEYPAVIVPLFTQHFTLLQRNLVYTALTRAKYFCVFVGQPKALAIALNNNKSVERLTFLKTFLNQ